MLACASMQSRVRRRVTISTIVLLLSGVITLLGGTSASADPVKPDPGPGNRSAAGNSYQPVKPKTVPKKQQYHIAVSVSQGSQTLVNMTSGLTKITSIVEKHLDPKDQGLLFTLDEQEGLRLSASSATAPGTYMLRILGQGCYETQCGLSFDTKATVTVTQPIGATPGTEQFTQPSQDRI